MIEYRFVTPNRVGKWYRSLRDAQKYACRIGAGFLSEATKYFVTYPGVELECRERALEQIPDSSESSGPTSGLAEKCCNAVQGASEVIGKCEQGISRFYVALQNNSFASAEQACHDRRLTHSRYSVGDFSQ